MAVITASSNTGLSAVQQLVAMGTTRVRAVVRTSAKAEHVKASFSSPPPAEVLQCVVGPDATDPASLPPAFDGASYAVIVTVHSGDFARDADLTTALVDAAVTAGVRHIVLVGSWTVHAADRVPILAQRFIGPEAHLKALADGGMLKGYTVLRGGFFARNFLFSMAPKVKEASQVLLPPNVRLPVVDPADIGRCAAAVVGGPDGPTAHAGKAYEMSGPEVQGGAEFAAVLSSVLGRDVTYTPVPVEDAVKLAPLYMAQLMRYLDDQGAAAVPASTHIKDLTGSVTSFEQFVTAHKDAF